MARLQFTLRTLLVVVAICAVIAMAYRWSRPFVPRDEVYRLRVGMNPEEIEGVLGSPEEKGSLTGDWDGHDLTGQGYEWWFYRNERGDIQVGLLLTNERLAKWSVAPSP